jgi:hypothetical protein
MPPAMTATLARSAKVTSAGLSSPVPTAISDADMAWTLAEAADACLTGHERIMTFVELGCGEHHLVIERILDAVMSNQMMLPVAIFERLTCWLNGYAGSPEEPQLRQMLADVRARRFERFVHIHPRAGRRAPRTHTRHQPSCRQ